MTAIAVSSTSGEAETSPTDDLLLGFVLLGAALSIWASIQFNQDVLVEKAMRDQRGSSSWVETNLSKKSTDGHPKIEVSTDRASTEVLETFGLQVPAIGPNEKASEPAVDINTASLEALVSTGVFTDQQIDKIVSKQGHGGFRTIDEVRIFLDLQPHELAQMMKAVSLVPPTDRKPKGRKRIVDF
jgi:hypothetical protein